MVADYSAIEARCVLWEAGANTALDVFRTGGNIYCDMATGIYGYKVGKKTHKSEYQFGKQAILGLGYGMGYLTFLLTCRKYKIYFTRDEVLHIMGQEKLIKYEAWIHDTLCLDGPPTDTDPEVMKKYANKRRQAAKNIRRLVDAREKPKEIVHELALMKYTVDVYRSRYPEVKQLWKDQEQAAIKAVRQWKKLFNAAVKEARLDWMLSGDEISYSLMSWETSAFKDAIEGPSVESGKTRWQVLGGFLCCFLPSGRPIRYRDPEIKMIKTTWGEDKPALRYMSVNGTTRKWERTYTYGGKTVENITQGIARDILAEAMLRVYARYEYDPAFTVHDELASEINTGEGSIEEYIELLCTVSSWAEGCPIDAEGERLTRYKK
jgi:DNA polymerase